MRHAAAASDVTKVICGVW